MCGDTFHISTLHLTAIYGGNRQLFAFDMFSMTLITGSDANSYQQILNTYRWYSEQAKGSQKMWHCKECCMIVIRGYIQKFPDWVDNEIYTYNNEHSLRSNTKGYGGKFTRLTHNCT